MTNIQESSLKETVTVNLYKFPVMLHTRVKRYQLLKRERGVKLTFPQALYELLNKAVIEE